MNSDRKIMVINWTGPYSWPKFEPEKEVEFEKRKLSIHDAIRRQLRGFRIFVSDVGTQPRILERLEASIMGKLYQQPAPFCDIPDKGMMLAPRWESESPITVENKCRMTLYGLSIWFEI